MPAALSMSLVGALSVLPCDLKADTVVTINRMEVTVSDVVVPSCPALNADKSLGNLPIARLPESGQPARLDRSVVKSLVHRRVPGMTFSASPDDAGSMTFASGATSKPRAPVGACAEVVREIERGHVVSASDIRPVACRSGQGARTALTYDRRHGVLRTLRQIAAGEALGRLDVPGIAFDAGDRLELSIVIGPVRIGRDVVALEPAPSGSRVFVQDNSGEIFSAPTAPSPIQELAR